MFCFWHAVSPGFSGAGLTGSPVQRSMLHLRVLVDCIREKSALLRKEPGPLPPTILDEEHVTLAGRGCLLRRSMFQTLPQ